MEGMTLKTYTGSWVLRLGTILVAAGLMAANSFGADILVLAQATGAAAELGQEMKGARQQLQRPLRESDAERPVFAVEEAELELDEEALEGPDGERPPAAPEAAEDSDVPEPEAGEEDASVAPEEAPDEGAGRDAEGDGDEDVEEDADEDVEDVDAAPAPRARPARPRREAEQFDIRELRIEGDRELLDELGLVPQMEFDVVGHSLSGRDIQAIARRYNRDLVQQGYYLARVWTPPTDYREGVVVFAVDKGRVGEMAFYEKGVEEPTPYDGHFTARQLARRMGNIREGEAFDYNEFYKGVFRMNSHPDLTVDTDLKVRRERVDEDLLRYVDMDFFVEDRLPIHGVFEIRNSGTEATEEWRMGLTLQHLNLTKHDDVLTVTLPFSIDLSTLQSVAGSYYLPHYIGHGGAFTLYGGYSKLDAENLVPEIDLEGTGWFVGLQGTYELLRSDYHQLNVSLGLAHQVIEDTLVLQGGGGALPREVALSPLSLVFSYSSVQPDRWGGRNFLTSLTTANFGGFLGSSDDEEIRQQRETAEADYYVERLQLARIQPVFGKDEGNKWLIFVKLDGQYASGALVPSEQKAVGGIDNVRGYIEREVFGDYGVSGTVELRSPIYSSSYLAGLQGKDEAGTERLQLVFFADGAQMFIEDALANQTDSFDLLSVGLGFRLALTQHAQLKIDWGFPIEETADSDSSGRGHVSAEIQF